MSSGGYLVPPSEKPGQAELWNETWKRLDRFLPALFTELFPEQKESSRRISRENKAPLSSGGGDSEEVKKEEQVESAGEAETKIEKAEKVEG
jgi:brefeldin A-resistance guanine nucleotide exchange factor 1